MKTQTLLSLSLSALVLGGGMVGCTANGGGIASASSKAVGGRQAAAQANKAARWLAKGDARAVAPAEAAVAGDPQNASYRVLLGQAYLKAGRFTSAHTAFADALSLSPADGKAAINLVLTQIAEGQWDAARRTLDTNASTIPASDRGLAMALAGDPAGGVEVLVAATRSPDADMKTRQNLALAMALAGRWKEARAIAATDLPAEQVDARIMEWAAFAKPNSASDQVASLLGVVPVKDPGQPVALALVAPASVGVAKVEAPVETVLPGPSVAEQVAVAEPAPAAVAEPAPVAIAAQMRADSPVVRAPVTLRAVSYKTKLAATPVAVAAPTRVVAKGNFYVQLGAFDSAAVAKDAWGRAQRRYAAFAAQTPAGMAFQSKAGSFYRLSLGGFSRVDADAMCRTYRAKGGACFVRAGAGDRVAQWVKPGVQLASR